MSQPPPLSSSFPSTSASSSFGAPAAAAPSSVAPPSAASTSFDATASSAASAVGSTASGAAATVGTALTSAWASTKDFVLGNTVLVITVAVLVVLAILLTYAVLYYDPVRALLGLPTDQDARDKAKVDAAKVVLPRDGATSVKGTKHKGTGVTTTDEGQALVDAEADTHAAQAQAKLPRPDPNPVSPNDEEVFNVSNNVYAYDDAPAVCKAFNARLATPEEVEKAWKQGADWCNYGWTEGQQALYPTQQATYDKLQGSEEHAHDCGVVGVNGGYFENPELQFGVNCYGKKPEPRLQEKELIGYFPDYISDKERRLQERVAEIRDSLDDVTVLPYNREQWDEKRTVMERVDDWMRPDKAREATETRRG